VSEKRHDAADRQSAPSTAARPESRSIDGQQRVRERLAGEQGVSVFGRAAQVVSSAAQAIRQHMATVRERLAAIAGEIALWQQRLAALAHAEQTAVQAKEAGVAAEVAIDGARRFRFDAAAVEERRTAVTTDRASGLIRERIAQVALTEAQSAQRLHAAAAERSTAAAATTKDIVQDKAKIRELMTAEEWAAYRKQRAAERSAEAQAKRAAAIAAATPREENRRRAKREQVREERLRGERKKSKRKDKKKDKETYRKVASRDARHEKIYRTAIATSFQEERTITGDRSWQFSPVVVVESIATSTHHRIIGRSPLLEGVEPTARALAKALDQYAARQAYGVRQKPVREIILSHPDGVAVSDQWLVFQACRHLAALGLPPGDIPWVLARHSEHDHQHAHLVYVPVEEDGTTYVVKNAVVATALETGRQDAWCEVPAGRLHAPTAKLKDIRNGYYLAEEGGLYTERVTPDGAQREDLLLQGAEAAAFRLEHAGAPIDQHGHTAGTATHKASAQSALGKLCHNF
jgi:hypothetical protein